MIFIPALFFFAQSFVAITHAVPAAVTTAIAPVAPHCIHPDAFKAKLFIKLHEDLGVKFTRDFNEAYKLTLKLAQFEDNSCYDYENGQFLCDTLQTVYKVRIPEAAETILQDCNIVLDEFYNTED